MAVMLHQVPATAAIERARSRPASSQRPGRIAELGAASLCAAPGIVPEPRADHAAYLAGWLAVLKSDRRAICNAAAYAQKATDEAAPSGTVEASTTPI